MWDSILDPGITTWAKSRHSTTKPSSQNALIFFFKDFIYESQRERETEGERERNRHRQREKQAPCREPDVGLDLRSPGSHPGPKAALNCWATGAAQFHTFKEKNIYLFILEEGEGQRESERENPKQIPFERRAQCGAWSHYLEIMTWAETKSWTLNRLSHPGPSYLFWYVI